MSERERIAIVVDGGSSARRSPQFPEVMDGRVTVMPLDLQFFSNGQWETFSGFDIPDEEFYERMRGAKVLPQTSGAIPERAKDTFRELGKDNNKILAINITSEHSGAYNSTLLAASEVEGEIPGLTVRVIDSKNLSIVNWFLAKQASDMVQNGASFEDITRVTLETIPKLETEVVLNTIENIIKSGRLKIVEGWAGSLLKLRPVVYLENGKITKLKGLPERTLGRGMRVLVRRLKENGGMIERLAVVHDNNPTEAETLADLVSENGFYPRQDISIYEAGPVIAVHAGEGSLAIVRQRK